MDQQTHAQLMALRDRTTDPVEQQRLAPAEHRAFAREWTQEQPWLAVPSLLAAIPSYQLIKALRMGGKGATPLSLEQAAEAYRGLGEGLFGPTPD